MATMAVRAKKGQVYPVRCRSEPDIPSRRHGSGLRGTHIGVLSEAGGAALSLTCSVVILIDDPMEDEVRCVLLGHALLAKKPYGEALSLVEYGHKDVPARCRLAAQSLGMEHRAQHHALKGRRRPRFATVIDVCWLSLAQATNGFAALESIFPNC